MNQLWRLAQIFEENTLNVPKVDASKAGLQPVLQIVFGLAGGVALIVIIIAGIQFSISGGDPGKVAKAKNAIIYAAIGLAISISAFGIVTFVVGRV